MISCHGHENLLALHKTTLEFTTDSHLSTRGDCIIGVRATMMPKAREGEIEIDIEVNKVHWKVRAIANPGFSSTKEMVIRRSEFCDARTFAIRADKAACDMPRAIVEKMRDPNTVMSIRISSL